MQNKLLNRYIDFFNILVQNKFTYIKISQIFDAHIQVMTQTRHNTGQKKKKKKKL